MKKIFKNITLAVFLFMVPGVLVSCSDDAIYDFEGNSGFVFLSTPTSTTVKSLPNTFYVKVKKTVIGLISEENVKFPVRSTIPVSKNVEVTLEVQNNRVADYNKTHGTSYDIMPEDILVLKNKNVQIQRGSYLSQDSVEISFHKEKGTELEAKNYMIPIVIKSVNGDLKVSDNKNVIYLLVSVSEDLDYIWDDASSANMQGQLVTDHTSWKVSTTAALKTQNGDFSKLFDGNDYTIWNMTSSSDIPLLFDLGKEYDVTGIYNSYYNSGIITSNQIISVSSDNINWTAIGAPARTMSKIIFYKAVKLRYIKWTVPTTTNWRGTEASFRLGEFNVYTK